MISKEKNKLVEKAEDQPKNPEFLSTISHELRAPLATVREGLAQIEGGFLGGVNRKQKAMMRLILDQVDRLYSIVNDLLDLSRMEAGKTSFHKTLFNLSLLTRHHTQSFRHLLNKKSIVLKLALPEDPIMIFADPVKITQVLTNLIFNAYKFTPKYGKIVVGIQKNLSEITVSVSDNGIGIEPEDLPRLFSKFSQVGSSSRTNFKGTGLGLAISKGLVEFHKGRIWAESSAGRGSKFIFTLPLLTEEEISRECVEAGIRDAAQHKSPMSLFVIKFESDEEPRVRAKKISPQSLLKELELHLAGIFRESTGASFNEKSEYILMLPGAGRKNANEYEKKFKFLISGFTEQVKKKYGVDLKVKMGLSIYPEEGETGDKLLLKARISIRELILTKEHRSKPRKNYHFHVNFVESAAKPMDLQTIDISEGGLCLNSDHNVEVGSSRSIVLDLPDGRGKVRAKAVVRWVEKMDVASGYKVGLQFSDMDCPSKKALKDFLNQKISHDRS